MDYLSFFIETWAGRLIGFCIVEMVFFLFYSPQYLMSIVGKDEEAKELSGKYRSSALSTSGMVFAGIIFIIANSEELSKIEPALEVFYVSIGLLISTFLIEGLTQHREIWLLYQEIALEYGVIGLLLGIWILSQTVVIDSAGVIFVVLVIAVMLRIRELIGEVEAYSGLGDKSRLEFWCDFVHRKEL